MHTSTEKIEEEEIYFIATNNFIATNKYVGN